VIWPPDQSRGGREAYGAAFVRVTLIFRRAERVAADRHHLPSLRSLSGLIADP
jgi:hypothetical protein